MRRVNAVVATLAAATLLAGIAAAPSGASVPDKKKPVKLSGKVNNEGTKKVKDGTITVEADDFSFGPTFIKGKAGEEVTVEVDNQGSATHTFTINDQDVDEELSPGDNAEITVKIPKSGSANFYCRFHKSSGMQGALFSKAGGTAKSSPSSGSGGDDDSSGGYGY